MFKIIKVTGESLWPDYKEGDFVIITKIPFYFKNVKRGDTVVFRHSHYGILIKYVDQINTRNDTYRVVGIHPDSLDSRKLGVIKGKDFLGKVVFHLKKYSKE